MDSRQDENIEMCQRHWQCKQEQWRCYTGQCIKSEWVLDGEWDCPDASDEQAIFFSRNAFSMRNLKLKHETMLREHYNGRYRTRPFGDICDLSSEYPCYRADALDPLNITQYRPCINLTQIGDGYVDCVGALDERNIRQHCTKSSMLGYYFQCSNDNQCVRYDAHCGLQCTDSRIQCHGFNKSSDCSSSSDFMCLNGICAKGGWCNLRADCLHGEDEHLCKIPQNTYNFREHENYRVGKKLSLEKKQKVLGLPMILWNMDTTQIPSVNITVSPNRFITNHYRLEDYPSSVPFWCNRGVGVLFFNGSIVCFCSPQYYGDKCQYHSDRLTVLVHLNLSQQIYEESTNPITLLKVLIILLHENESVMIESFHVRPSTEMTSIKKTIHHLLYSRSNNSLMQKRTRYFNRSSIINHHPYSVAIEAYELQMREKPRLIGVWRYPIYFDFLPNSRLVKVLRLTKLDDSLDPCLSNPCNNHQKCHRLLNEPSRFICLCQANFSGKECSIEDKLCQDGFCGSNALCKSNYRRLVNGNGRVPYCLCPLNRLGDRCQLNYDLCGSNPCLNGGTCLPTPEVTNYFCLCTEKYYGNDCQLKKHAVHLRIDR
ncbi:unnamed protein product, partial [Rotaria sp. Silwood2]